MVAAYMDFYLIPADERQSFLSALLPALYVDCAAATTVDCGVVVDDLPQQMRPTGQAA